MKTAAICHHHSNLSRQNKSGNIGIPVIFPQCMPMIILQTLYQKKLWTGFGILIYKQIQIIQNTQ